MKKLILAAIVAAFAIALPSPAQSNAPYTEGPVWEIGLVRTKHGMADTYFKSIAKTFKAVMEEAKQKGIIIDYKILYGKASSATDFDVISIVQVKNYAFLDRYREMIDPIARRIEGDTKVQHARTADRVDMREIIGYKFMREITLIDEDGKE
jgi:hypothetical protein